MKKLCILILVFSFSNLVLMAQDSNVLIGLNAPAYGVTIKTNFPNQTTGWTRGFNIANEDNTVPFIKLGAYGVTTDGIAELRYSYIGKAYNTPYMVFAINGDIGIGTTTPKEKLSVNGNIRAREVKVETANWPDYVFAEAYQPMSLSNLKTFVKENNHLPGIPSAKEVKEEGISLGEMNRKLLEKIEELTLHVIKQQEELNNIKTELEAIKKRD